MSNPAPEDPKAHDARKEAQRRDWLVRRQQSIKRQLAAIDMGHVESLKSNLADVTAELAKIDRPAARPAAKKSE
jgi:hypothetical protein